MTDFSNFHPATLIPPVSNTDTNKNRRPIHTDSSCALSEFCLWRQATRQTDRGSDGAPSAQEASELKYK